MAKSDKFKRRTRNIVFNFFTSLHVYLCFHANKYIYRYKCSKDANECLND